MGGLLIFVGAALLTSQQGGREAGISQQGPQGQHTRGTEGKGTQECVGVSGVTVMATRTMGGSETLEPTETLRH